MRIRDPVMAPQFEGETFSACAQGNDHGRVIASGEQNCSEYSVGAWRVWLSGAWQPGICGQGRLGNVVGGRAGGHGSDAVYVTPTIKCLWLWLWVLGQSKTKTSRGSC